MSGCINGNNLAFSYLVVAPDTVVMAKMECAISFVKCYNEVNSFTIDIEKVNNNFISGKVFLVIFYLELCRILVNIDCLDTSGGITYIFCIIVMLLH